MSVKPRSLVAFAIVVCASLAVLALQGVTEWFADLLVSASAGLAGRLKGRGSPEDGEDMAEVGWPHGAGPGHPPRRHARRLRPARRPRRRGGPGARRVGPLTQRPASVAFPGFRGPSLARPLWS